MNYNVGSQSLQHNFSHLQILMCKCKIYENVDIKISKIFFEFLQIAILKQQQPTAVVKIPKGCAAFIRLRFKLN